MRSNWPLILTLLLAPLIAAWPLPTAWANTWLTTPFGEAVIHVWGLWTVASSANLFAIETQAIAWPAGVEAVLADPINLGWFVLGWPFGPEAAYNTIIYGNLVVMGVAGVCLARSVGGHPMLGLLAAVINPSVLGAATGGITEQLTIGWLGIFLAALLQALRTPDSRWSLAAGVLLAVTVASGPYIAVWAAICATAIGLAHLRQLQSWRPLATTAALGVLLASPLIHAILTGRIAGQPGTSGMARFLLNPPAANTSIFRGGTRFGTDLTDPFFPIGMTGGATTPTYTAYLGIAALLLATVVVIRRRQHWPWLVGALGFAVLSLGPWLMWKGAPVVVNGEAIAAPVGWLAQSFESVGRISHWHRAGGVAALLLVPLVSLIPRVLPSRVVLPAAAALLMLDRVYGSPVSWPLPTMQSPSMAAHSPLINDPGPVLVQPTRFPDIPPPRARVRDPALLAQLYHHRAISEAGAMGHGLSKGALHANNALERLAAEGRVDHGHRTALTGPGYRWLAVYTSQMRSDARRDARWAACLGAPVTQDGWVRIYDLSPGIHPACLSGGPSISGPPSPEGPETF